MTEELLPGSARPPQRVIVRGVPRITQGVPRITQKEGNPHVDAPFTLRQGPTLEAIGEISKHPSTRDRFLDALGFVLQGDLDYVDVLLSFGAIKTEAERNHLRKHWYRKDDPKKGWWPQCQPIVGTIVEGVIAAFEAAKNTGLPVAYYWMIYGDGQKKITLEEVLVRVYQSEEHILLIKYTPPPH
jgi:hypothetical protein